jgi:hypothetical protein
VKCHERRHLYARHLYKIYVHNTKKSSN